MILGLSGQFERLGTDALENPQIWRVPSIEKAGGMRALLALGKPAQALQQAKARLFAA